MNIGMACLNAGLPVRSSDIQAAGAFGRTAQPVGRRADDCRSPCGIGRSRGTWPTSSARAGLAGCRHGLSPANASCPCGGRPNIAIRAAPPGSRCRPSTPRAGVRFTGDAPASDAARTSDPPATVATRFSRGVMAGVEPRGLHSTFAHPVDKAPDQHYPFPAFWIL